MVLSDAYRRAEQAYALARRLVFDVQPPVAPDELTDEQRQALEELERAEADLNEARRSMAAARRAGPSSPPPEPPPTR